MKFDPNIGGYLRRAFANNTAVHAYVIVGEKQLIPSLLAECAYVAICPSHIGDDNCEACNKVSISAHQDVISLPTDAVKNRLTVADISYLTEESYKRPVDNSACRVFLINAVNSVTGQGSEIWQNKLLKTLEEPADGVYLFIGVTDSEALLPTVRSRCQVLKQTKLDVKQVRDILINNGFEKRSCEMAAAMSGGAVSAGERCLSNPQVFKAYEAALDTALNMTSTKNALKYASVALSLRDNVSDYLAFYALLLRESIAYRVNDALCMLPSFKNNIRQICSNYTLSAATACIERLNDAAQSIADGANTTVVIDLLLNSILEIRYLTRD